jgi:hypothetical protein
MLMNKNLKSYQKKVKFPLCAGSALLSFGHRKIVLGGTTARRSHRLRRAVFFSASPQGAALLILSLGRRLVFR